MSLVIRYIENPPYQVDFNDFIKSEKKPSEPSQGKIQVIAFTFFKCSKNLGAAFGVALYTTLSNSGISFKQIVFGYYGARTNSMLKQDIFLIAFKIVYWVAAMGMCCVATTARLFAEKMNFTGISAAQSALKTILDEEINIDHLQCHEAGLDTSLVPQEVKVDDLLKIYDEINFNDRSSPGYMAPSSRKECDVTFTVEDLRKSLELFVSNVNNRVAFLGTPPSYDTPRLMDFYQQIEDAVRLSLYKAGKGLQDFQILNGLNIEAYTPSQLKDYQDLLENRSRIAIDLAIAGKHCGARYMGDSMDTYYTLYQAASQDSSSLKDHLFQLLAHKRLEIARKQIAKHLGANTHSYSLYLGSLGQILALPGTKNIIESLSHPLDQTKYLKLFCEEYTVNTIVDAIQHEIKTSQSFRGKFTDWIRDQVNGWKSEDYPIETAVQKIECILQVEVIDKQKFEDFEVVQALMIHLQTLNIDLSALPQEQDNFLTEVLALDAAKDWLAKRFPTLSKVHLMKKKNSLKMIYSELGSDLFKKVKSEILSKIPLALATLEDVKKNFEVIDKVKKIRQIPHFEMLQEEVFIRAITGKITLKAAVENHLNLVRRNDFLDKLQLESMAVQGLSSDKMEWLLVSQNILLAQV